VLKKSDQARENYYYYYYCGWF